MPNRAEDNPWTLFERPTPRPIDRGLELTLQSQFLSKKERNLSNEFRTAELMFQRYLAGKPPEVSFQEYLRLFHSIQNAHYANRRKDGPHGVKVLNAYQDHLLGLVGLEQADHVSAEDIDQIRGQSDKLSNLGGVDGWWSVKVLKIGEALKTQRATNSFIDGMKSRLAVVGSEQDPQKLATDADELWKVLLEERKYGVRTAFYTSPLFLDPESAFFVHEADMGFKKPDQSPLQRNALAMVSIGVKPSLDADIEPSVSIHNKPDKENTKYILGTVEGLRAAYLVHREGKIYLSPFSPLPLRRAFEQRSAVSEYEYWRVFTYMRLHDLTREADKVERMPAIDEAEEKILDSSKKSSQADVAERTQQYRRLLVPRVKLGSPEEDTEMPEAPRRIFAYNLEWFVRSLPALLRADGQVYQATKAAEEIAAEAGVTLRKGQVIEDGNQTTIIPGETIVKPDKENRKTDRPTKVTKRK